MASAPHATPIPGVPMMGHPTDLPATPNRATQEVIIGDSLPVRNRPFVASSSPTLRQATRLRKRQRPITENPFAPLAEIEELEPEGAAEEAIAKAQKQLNIRASVLRAYTKAVSQCTQQFISGYGKKFATQLQNILFQHWQNTNTSCDETAQATAPAVAPIQSAGAGAGSFASIAKKTATHRPGDERLPLPRPKITLVQIDKRVLIRIQPGSGFFEKERGLQIQLAIRDKLQLRLSDMPNIKQTNTGWALTARTEAIQQRIIDEQQIWGPCVDLRIAEKPTVWHSYQIHDFPKAIPSWDGSMLNYEETVQTAIEEQAGLKPVQWRQSKKTDPNSPTTTLIISFAQPLKSSFRLLGQGTFSLPLTHTKKIEQCQNCWAFHAPDFCRGTQCCGNCSSVEHQTETCTQRSRCANCYGPHNASYEHCFAQPKKAKNGLRALSKTELLYARKQGAAAYTRQNATPPEVSTPPVAEAPQHAMTDVEVVQIGNDTEPENNETETEEDEAGATPSPVAATIVVANQANKSTPNLPSTHIETGANKAIKAKYRRDLCPEPAEPSSEPIMTTFRPSAPQRSPPSSPPARDRSPTKTRRLKAPTNYGRK